MLTVCLKWHITKAIKGPGPYATRCKHGAMFVIILLGYNDIAGKKSRAWCVAMFSFLLCFEVLFSVPWLQSRNSERAVWGRTAGQHLEAHLMIIKSVTGYLLNWRKRVGRVWAFEGTEWFGNVCPCEGFKHGDLRFKRPCFQFMCTSKLASKYVYCGWLFWSASLSNLT